eukprot:m.202299 g.202299  ORF g.202299 m.202299 type:complete len:428 (+) comp21721_c0_seq1:38-1321(+)
MTMGRDCTIRVPSLLLAVVLIGYAVVLHYQLRTYWPAMEMVEELRVDVERRDLNYRRVLDELAEERRRTPAPTGAVVDLAKAETRRALTECGQQADALKRERDVLQEHVQRIEMQFRNVSDTLEEAMRRNAQPTDAVNQHESDFKVFVMALTAPSEKAAHRRAVMRKTWLTYRRPGGEQNEVQHRFIIGTAGLPDDVLADLAAEQREYGDLALLPHFKEAFTNLTGKLLEGFSWSANRSNIGRFDYLMKVDDDTFVRLDRIGQELEDVAPGDRDRLYWGYFDGRAEVRRRGKYAEMDWVICDRYLPYALGGGYIVSRALAEYVAANRYSFARFNAEDASLGLWLAPLNITRKHDVRFDTEWRPRGCFNKYVVLHKREASDMLTKHERLLNTSFQVQCPTEYQNGRRVEYEYNWSVLPSKCCPGRGMH